MLSQLNAEAIQLMQNGGILTFPGRNPNSENFSFGVSVTLRMVDDTVACLTVMAQDELDVLYAWQNELGALRAGDVGQFSHEALEILHDLRDGQMRDKAQGWYWVNGRGEMKLCPPWMTTKLERELQESAAGVKSAAAIDLVPENHPAASQDPKELTFRAVAKERIRTGDVIGFCNRDSFVCFASGDDADAFETDASRKLCDGLFTFDLGRKTPKLIMDACPFGNVTAVIKAAPYVKAANCQFSSVIRKGCTGDIEIFMATLATKAIKRGEELLTSYGDDFWETWNQNAGLRKQVAEAARMGDRLYERADISTRVYSQSIRGFLQIARPKISKLNQRFVARRLVPTDILMDRSVEGRVEALLLAAERAMEEVE